jgi:hypothetical protein
VRVTVRDWLEPSTCLWPDGMSGPWEVRLTWSEGPDGSVGCSGLALSLRAGADYEVVTSTLLRELPVARLVAQARREQYARAGGDLVEAFEDGQEIDLSEGFIEGLKAAASAWADRPQGRRTELGAEHFGEVAQVYSAAASAGAPPLLAVETRWTVSRPTASRWVRAARDAGLLPPTERGVARGNGPLAQRKSESKKEGTR